MKIDMQLVPHGKEIEKYLSECECGEKEREGRKTALTEFFRLVQEKGHTQADESDIDAYRELCGGKNTQKGVKDKIRRVRNFLEWQKKGESPLSETTEVTEELTKQEDSVIDVESQDVEAEREGPVEEPHTEPMSNKSKSGRKRLDSEHGEIRSEKITVYLTPKQAEALKVLCIFDSVTVADRINTLVDNDIKANEDIINGFFDLKKLRKEQ